MMHYLQGIQRQDFSSETMKDRSKWSNIFRMLKGKNWPSRILCSVKMSIRNKDFLKQKKTERVSFHQNFY